MKDLKPVFIFLARSAFYFLVLSAIFIGLLYSVLGTPGQGGGIIYSFTYVFVLPAIGIASLVFAGLQSAFTP